MLLHVACLTNYLDHTSRHLTRRLLIPTRGRGDEYVDRNDVCQDSIEFREILDLRKKFLEKRHKRTGASPKKRSNTGSNSTNNQYWNCNMHFHYTRTQCRSEVVLSYNHEHMHIWFTYRCVPYVVSGDYYHRCCACFVVTYIADKSQMGMSRSQIKIIVRRFKR